MVICHAPPGRVVGWIQNFIIMEDVTLADVRSAFSLYPVFGPCVEKALALIGVNGHNFEAHVAVLETKIEAYELIIGEAEPVLTSLNILVPVSSAGPLWKVLVDGGA
jgi:hypothetical protein